MTKKKFLKLLEEKLKNLDEKERQKIINEYSNIIDEKLKKVKTEQEVVSELGNIDQLVNNILKHHKKTTNYIREASKEAKKVMDKFDKIIDDISKILNKGLKNIFNNLKKTNGDINIKFIFELFIKINFSIFFVLFLKIPFEFVSYLGEIFIYTFLTPIGNFLSIVLNLVLFIFYIIVCILVVISVFKKYFDKTNYNPILTINKIMVTIIFLLPIWCINFALIITIIFGIYLLFQGISMLGLIIILIGLSLLLGILADIINSIIHNSKKIYVFPFIISAILIMVGSVIFTYNMKNFEFIEGSSKSIDQKEFIYEESIRTKTEIQNADIIIDEVLADGQIIIKIDYYDIIEPTIIKNNNEIEIEFTYVKANIIKAIINDLSENKICNYKKVFKTDTKIYVNSNTSKLIET